VWRIALASAIGTSHIAAGLPCQDSAAQELLETPDGPVLVVVVSDGAGSAAYADAGSAFAVGSFIDKVRAYFADGGAIRSLDRATASGWVEEMVRALEETARASSHAVRDYACTFLGAIVGDEVAAFVQIGDGAIVVADGDDGWSWVFWPQHGEFANTTNFIVSADAADVMEFAVTSGRINEIALFSDGIENLVLHQASRTVHGAFFDAMFPAVRKARPGVDDQLSASLEKYLLSPGICDRTDDDKSLILASRRETTVCEEARGESSP